MFHKIDIAGTNQTKIKGVDRTTQDRKTPRTNRPKDRKCDKQIHILLIIIFKCSGTHRNATPFSYLILIRSHTAYTIILSKSARTYVTVSCYGPLRLGSDPQQASHPHRWNILPFESSNVDGFGHAARFHILTFRFSTKNKTLEQICIYHKKSSRVKLFAAIFCA